MQVIVCAHLHHCQTSGHTFSMIYRTVCSDHPVLTHDLGAHSELSHSIWVNREKCVLSEWRHLRGLTAIGLCAKQAWQSVKSLFHPGTEWIRWCFLSAPWLGILGHIAYSDNFGLIFFWEGVCIWNLFWAKQQSPWWARKRILKFSSHNLGEKKLIVPS